MTVTLSDLVDEVTMNLAGYTLQQDRTTHLTSAITTTTSTLAAPTTFSLNEDNVGKGMVQIGDELIWIDDYDRISKTATVPPYGRGFMGTTADEHAAGDRVVIAPTFPRHSVKRAIQDTIRAIGSSIFAAKNTSFNYNPVVDTYAFTGLNIQNILRMSWQEIGASKRWIPIARFTWDSSPDATTWGATSQTVTINDRAIHSGRKINVTYATAPSTLSETSEESFSAQTGLPESVRDVVVLGAAYRLLSFLDPARNALTSPQADEIDAKRTYGSGNTATRALYQLYATRLAEETQAQQQQYPLRPRYSRQEPSMAVRKYSSRSQKTTLASAITSSSASITVVSAAALMGGKTLIAGQRFTVVIDPDTALEEIVDIYKVDGNPVSSNTIAIQRSIDGSIPQAHSAGAEVRHMAIGQDYQEANDHINNVTSAHGLTIANVLETTDTDMITTAMLQDNSVTTAKITNANITTAKLADSAITTAKITDANVTTAKIADSAITSAKIADGTIATGDIADAAITTAKVADGSITSAKLADGGIATADIADLAITTGKVADSAITSAKIADGTIVAGDIADGAITSAKILDGTIATADIADSAITSAKIADGTIVNTDVSGTAGIAYTKLSLGGSITSADLVDGTIVASDIANGTITAAKMVSDPYARANHTGTQAASTISDFDTQVRTSKLNQMAAPAADVSMATYKITNLGTPASNADAATKLYVDTKVADLVNSAPGTLDTLGEIASAIQSGGTVYESFVLKAGSTMTGALTLSGAPTSNLHAATKAYVDTVAGSTAAAEAAAAAAAASYDSFDDRYLGAKSTPPTVDNDGNALIEGAIYWNSVTNAMYAWTGTEWGSISSTADIYRFRFTASGGETSVSGADVNGLTLAYIPGKEQVYLNGVLLARTSDYTASNGTSISSLAALTAGDIVEIITFTAFELADSIARSVFDAKGDLLVGTSADTPGKLTVGTNGKFLKANSGTSTGLEWADVPNPDLTPYATEIMTIMGAY